MTKMAIRGAVAAGAAGLAVSLLGASGATAGDFDRFANCPVNNPSVVTCVHSAQFFSCTRIGSSIATPFWLL